MDFDTTRMSADSLFTVYMGSMRFNNFMGISLTLHMSLVLLSFVSAFAVLTYEFKDLIWWYLGFKANIFKASIVSGRLDSVIYQAYWKGISLFLSFKVGAWEGVEKSDVGGLFLLSLS